jgi:hypothetical protein
MASYKYKGWLVYWSRAHPVEGLHHFRFRRTQQLPFAAVTSRTKMVQGTRASRKIWLGTGISTARTSNPLRTSSSRLFAASKT